MFEPTKIQFLTSLVEGNAGSVQTSSVRALTIRLPLHTYAAVQALSELSSSTKNAMVASLVDAAIDELSKNLSPERQKELTDLQGKILVALMEEEGFTVESQTTEMGKSL